MYEVILGLSVGLVVIFCSLIIIAENPVISIVSVIMAFVFTILAANSYNLGSRELLLKEQHAFASYECEITSTDDKVDVEKHNCTIFFTDSLFNRDSLTYHLIDNDGDYYLDPEFHQVKKE